MRARSAPGWGVLLMGLAACGEPAARAAELAPNAPRAPVPAAGSEPAATPAEPPATHAEPPVEAPPRELELELPGFLPLLVSMPHGERWPAPVLLVAHGAGGSAEMQCELWRSLVGERGILACLRGRAIRKGSADHGYYFPDHLALGREIAAALAALKRHDARWIDGERVYYAAYSQGAQMGVLALAQSSAPMPRLLLVEGGSGDWTPGRARRFAQAKGERVLIVCGTRGCRDAAGRSRAALERAGIESRVYYAPGAGHTYVGPITDQIEIAFEELTRGDSRWRR